jgi:anaerobic selenocysteine-containing dehydrogenase
VHTITGPDGRERVGRIEGDPDDVMSRGYICPKGVALGEFHHDPERLRRPLRRVGDGFEEIGWEEAIAFAGQRLREIRTAYGKDAIAVYQGNPTAHSSAVLAIEVLKKVLGTRNIFSASSVDQFPQYLAALEMFGDHTLMPIADLDHTDHLVIFGANPAVSNGSVSSMPDARSRIKAVRSRGGTVTVIDPRRTETARLADQHLSIRPGGDPALLLAMIHVILAEGLDRVPAWADGLDAVRHAVADWTPEVAAEPSGLDAAAIRTLALAFGHAPSAVAYGRIGVCHHSTGTLTHWLINVLNAITGNLDRPGGAMFSTPPVDLAQVLRLLWGRPQRGRWHSRVSGLPELHGELPSAAMPEEILTPGPRQARALITVAGNPALSHPEARRVDGALESLDLLICLDPYVTETSRHADLILPPVSHLERTETDVVFPYFGVRNNIRHSPSVFDPPAGSGDDFSLLLRLAAEVPSGRLSSVARRVLRVVAGRTTSALATDALVLVGPRGALRKGPAGLTPRKVKGARGGLDLGALEPRFPKRLRTPDHRVRLAPPEFVDALASMTRSAAEQATYDLQLIGRRHLRSNNSWLHNLPSMVKGKDRCTLLIHPEDAAARAVEPGERVQVTSPVGRIEVPIEISEEMRPGVVSLPHGWGHDVKGVGWSTAAAHPGVNVNVLTQSRLVDSLSGNAALNATWVAVAPVPA